MVSNIILFFNGLIRKDIRKVGKRNFILTMDEELEYFYQMIKDDEEWNSAEIKYNRNKKINQIMSKAKVKTESVENTTTIDSQIQADKDLLTKVRRITKPIQSEVDEIFYLYKKYIDPNAQSYCTTCNSGPMNSIIRYYWKVVALDENNLKPL